MKELTDKLLLIMMVAAVIPLLSVILALFACFVDGSWFYLNPMNWSVGARFSSGGLTLLFTLKFIFDPYSPLWE